MNPPSLPHQQVLRDLMAWITSGFLEVLQWTSMSIPLQIQGSGGSGSDPRKKSPKTNIGESKNAIFPYWTQRKRCFHTWSCLECIFFEFFFRHWSRLKAIIHLRGCTLTSFFLKQKRSYKQGVESTCFYIAHSLRVSPTNSQKNLFVFCLGIFDNSSSSMIAFWDVYTCKEKTIHGSVLESQI